MKKIIVILLAVVFFSLICISCNHEMSTEKSTKPKLLFKSGFENSVYIDTNSYEDSEDYRFIKGIDNETGFSWPIDIFGATESGLHYIDDDNHKAVFSELQTVI